MITVFAHQEVLAAGICERQDRVMTGVSCADVA